MSVRMVALGDICEFKYGKALSAQVRKNGDVAVFGSNGQVGTHDVPLSTGPTIIIGRKGTVGEVHYCEGLNWPIDTTYYIDQSATECHLRWLAYALKASRIRTLNKAAAVPGLNRNDAYLEPVVLPPLDEQKRIAAILDKADALRAKRRQAIALLDSLTQSIFLEMFGDPVSNPKGWPVILLLNASTKITDGTHDTPKRLAEGVPFLTGKNVRPYEIDLSQIEFVDQQTHEEIFRRCNPEFGDVLYVNIGAGVGSAAMNRLDFDFSLKNVALIKPDRAIAIGEYIEMLLNNWDFRARVLDLWAQGGAQKFLGLGSIRKIEIPCPPLELQTEFVKTLSSINASKSKLIAFEANAASLFASLQHRAFTGQL